jgi:hypothetical protein
MQFAGRKRKADGDDIKGKSGKVRATKEMVNIALARVAAIPNLSPVIDAAIAQVNLMMEDGATPFTRIVAQIPPETRAKLLKVTATSNDMGTRVKNVAEIVCGATLERLMEVESQCKHVAEAVRCATHTVLLRQFAEETSGTISWESMMQAVMDAPLPAP